MAKLGRPITCECMKLDSCKTCYRRIKRREWIAKNPERNREHNVSAQKAFALRLKSDPEAYAKDRAKRNARARAAYKAKRATVLDEGLTVSTSLTMSRNLTITELGEDKLYTFEEWVDTFGPIGTHGNIFHPLIA